MKKFKSLQEYKDYYAARSLKAYHKKMANPLTAEAYRAKRRVYEKRRRNQMLKELKDLE
jgi:hypothetical protein